jgi:hypothetical protein
MMPVRCADAWGRGSDQARTRVDLPPMKTIERARHRHGEPGRSALPSERGEQRGGRQRSKFKPIQARQILGLVLILGSLALGIAVVEGADRRTGVVVAARDLSAGVVIEEEDLTLVAMHLGASLQRYVTSTDALVGTIATEDFLAGELMRAAQEPVPDSRIMTFPIRLDRSPLFQRGDHVDLWATPQENGKIVGLPQLLAEDLLAVSVDLGRQGALGGSLSLAVSPGQVAQLVEALESAYITPVKR